MSKKIELLKNIFERSKKDLFLCIIITFFWGLIAHGFMFFNNIISSDSQIEFLAEAWVVNQKIAAGRFLVPVYETLVRGIVTANWFVGSLSLVFISMALFLIIKLFSIRSLSKKILISGILTVNITMVSLVGSFIHDADYDMLAMLMAVLSVYLWNRCKNGFIIGSICLTVALGLYQSYIATAITLIVMVCIMNLLYSENFKKVFINLIKGIAMVLMAVIIYLVCLKLIPVIFKLNITENYNSPYGILNLTPSNIINISIYSYYFNLTQLFNPSSALPDILNISVHILLFGTSFIFILKHIFSKKVRLAEKLFTIVLLLSLPFWMNVTYVLVAGMSHDVMHYALWLSYLFVLLILAWERNSEKKINAATEIIRVIAMALLFLILFSNVRFANGLYVIKGYGNDATLSLMTRVADRLDNKDDYIQGETPVAFIGAPDYIVEADEYKSFPRVTGANKSLNNMLSALSVSYKSYFKNVLNTNINIIPQDKLKELMSEDAVMNMPVFPDKKSIEKINGVYVIKMGNYDTEDI